jgi:hypothetical protein
MDPLPTTTDHRRRQHQRHRRKHSRQRIQHGSRNLEQELAGLGRAIRFGRTALPYHQYLITGVYVPFSGSIAAQYMISRTMTILKTEFEKEGVMLVVLGDC